MSTVSARSAALAVLAAALALPGAASAAPAPAQGASAAVAAPAAADRIATLRAQIADPDGPVLVIAHRACWADAPENSLPAIAACHRLGVAMVELDVRRTRDGHLVLMHDATVDRTTNGSGAVADMTLAEVRALRLRAGAGGPAAALTELSPPTLEEAMEAARGGLLVNIDAKADVFDQTEAVLKRLGLTDHVLMKTGAAPRDGQAFPSLLKTALFMPIIDERQGPVAQAGAVFEPLSPVAVEVLFRDEAYFRDNARALRAAGRRAWVNTLSLHHSAGHIDANAVIAPADHWGRLIDLGASMIQTDAPEALTAYLAVRAQAQALPKAREGAPLPPPVLHQFPRREERPIPTPPPAPVYEAVELRRYPAAEAGQGAAAHGEDFYAVVNTRIGRYAKSDGRKLAEWQGDPTQFVHLNACLIVADDLVCAHSNYPHVPMTSSVEFFDPKTLEHRRSVSLGEQIGSLTWVDWRDGAWWAAFANYDGRGGEPGRDHRYSQLVRFDDQWRRTQSWSFPVSVLERMAPTSTSGGGWGDDGLLYMTGHDAPEMYVMRLPEAGSTLVHVATYRIPLAGQGWAWDRTEPRVLYGINRPTREVVAVQASPLP